MIPIIICVIAGISILATLSAVCFDYGKFRSRKPIDFFVFFDASGSCATVKEYAIASTIEEIEELGFRIWNRYYGAFLPRDQLIQYTSYNEIKGIDWDLIDWQVDRQAVIDGTHKPKKDEVIFKVRCYEPGKSDSHWNVKIASAEPGFIREKMEGKL